MTTCRALEWEHKEPWTVTAEMGGDIASQKRKKKTRSGENELEPEHFLGGYLCQNLPFVLLNIDIAN